MNSLVTFAIRQRILVVLLLLVFLLGVGAISFLRLNIEAYPDPVPPLVDRHRQLGAKAARLSSSAASCSRHS
jgi:heavy metal efflux system protein